MAQSHENPFHPSSPRSSSGGADSFKGTPDTRLTTFSPDEGSANSARLLSLATRSASATPVKFSMNFHGSTQSHDKDRDPFITPGRGKGLSPTASTFQPFTPTSQIAPHTDSGSVCASLSAEIGLSRLLHLAYPSAVSVSEIDQWLNDLEEQGLLSVGDRCAQLVSGHTYVQFDDVRDACQAHASSQQRRREWSLDFANSANIPKHVSQYFGLDNSRPGQIFALAVLASGPLRDTYRVEEIIKRALQYHGTLFAFVKLSSFPDGTFRVLAEFCSAATAIAAVKATGTTQLAEGLQLTLLVPDAPSASPQELSIAFQDMSVDKETADTDQQRPAPSRAPPTARVHFPAFNMYPLMYQSPYGPGVPYMLDSFAQTGQTSPMAPMSPGYPVFRPLYQTPPSPALTSHNHQSPSRSVSSYARSEARRQNAARINRTPHQSAAGHHNHVDIHRIREGIDVRTTIMLRNIPNKVDQAMLNRIVDDSSWGKYDFMYLRIDFANDCNVGYAFINFVDPLDIIDFVDARGNQRWNCFKSDKVAEISYATIQGKDCLVQKFRNSSVMLEAPHYRPKLYFTSNGPMPELAGQEEPFPDPDNQSKMKRSCENAEHVGLFTPNAGQHFRDEQRRRRSQYDRGTRLAALEEYDYESTFHPMYGPGA